MQLWRTVCRSRDWTQWPGKPFQSYGKSNVYSKYSSCSAPSKFTINHVLWLLKKTQNQTNKKTPSLFLCALGSKSSPTDYQCGCTVLFSEIKKGKCIWWDLLAWIACQSATETNCSASSRTTKPPFPWIHVSRLIFSEIFWSLRRLALTLQPLCGNTNQAPLPHTAADFHKICEDVMPLTPLPLCQIW